MMSPLLAEASAQSLKDWLEVLLYVSGIIAAVAVAWGYLTGRSAKTELSGQPIDVRKHPGVVTREEWEQTHGRITRERREIDNEIRRVELASEKRAERFELKLDANTNMTSEMQGEVKHLNQSINNLTLSLNNFLRDRANQP